MHTGKSERSAHRRNHIQDPMSLCPARIYALCEQADFPRGERPLPVWGSKKYAAYHDYFDEWEERCATPVRTAARLANNTLVAPSSFPSRRCHRGMQVTGNVLVTLSGTSSRPSAIRR